MRKLRVGSAAIALVALLGCLLVQPGVASAIEPTALCSKAESECAEENLYPVGTELIGTSTNLGISTALGKITCASSKVEGATTADYGYSLPIEISSLSFSSCKIGATSCTIEAKNLPYQGWLEEAGTKSSFEMREGAAGAITLNASCASITCTFTAAEPAFSASNSGTLALTATNVDFKGVPAACEPGTLNGNFTVKTAGGANVLAAKPATPPVTLLPEHPPAQGPLKITIGTPEKVEIKSERAYKLSILVNGPTGTFKIKATNCPAELNAFWSCEDELATANGAVVGKEGQLTVEVANGGLIPPAERLVTYRLKVN